MRVLVVKQPWARLIASGAKTVEVRTWTTRYRGPVAIAAGCGWDPRAHLGREETDARGALVCVVDLLDVQAWDEQRHRRASQVPRDTAIPGHAFAWVIGAPRLVTPPLPHRGRLGLYADPQASALISSTSPSPSADPPRPQMHRLAT